ncbi:hypothetical protein MTR_0481s0010 [Medicago truncatula]|uniref:Uncharacterized protein n=1 Tax=Medicago truncatula TaxID=3880 RepID=A0A072TEC1_MEDTR|nr:hypothetical protein MTR_0481s0010 [Medicago truncatula]
MGKNKLVYSSGKHLADIELGDIGDIGQQCLCFSLFHKHCDIVIGQYHPTLCHPSDIFVVQEQLSCLQSNQKTLKTISIRNPHDIQILKPHHFALLSRKTKDTASD